MYEFQKNFRKTHRTLKTTAKAYQLYATVTTPTDIVRLLVTAAYFVKLDTVFNQLPEVNMNIKTIHDRINKLRDVFKFHYHNGPMEFGTYREYPYLSHSSIVFFSVKHMKSIYVHAVSLSFFFIILLSTPPHGTRIHRCE